MGVKDVTEKLFFSFNDVFAEVWNKLVLRHDCIDPDKLQDMPTETLDGGSEKPKSYYRDVMKVYGSLEIGYMLLGLENQTQPEKNMVLRIMRYDALMYNAQLELLAGASAESKKETDRSVKPVFTVVLYFGYTRRWRYPRSLRQICGIRDKHWTRAFSDYRIRIIEMAWLTQEERSCLTGDARILVDALYELRTKGKITGSKQKIRHVKALLSLLQAITGNPKLSMREVTQLPEGERTMTNLMEAYDNELLNRGWAKGLLAGREEGREEGLLAGREEGREEGLLAGREEGLLAGREEGLLAGREEGVFMTACNLLKLGIPLSSISIATGISEERLRKIAEDIDKE